MFIFFQIRLYDQILASHTINSKQNNFWLILKEHQTTVEPIDRFRWWWCSRFPSSKLTWISKYSPTVQKTKVSYCEPPLKLNFNSSSQGVNCHQCSLWTFFKISRSTEILHHLEIFQDSFGLVPISVKRNLIFLFYIHSSKRVFRYS